MNVSVVILTHNRNRDCAEAIESCLNQSLEPLEIIVVDDQSDVPFKYRHPRVKVIRCDEEMGLAAAKNLGFKEARGEIIAIIDDDCIADRNWTKVIKEIFHDNNVDIAAGKVIPLLNSRLPCWWNDDLSVFISVHGKSREEQPNVFGCNMAVKKETFLKFGYYNEKLGRKGGLLLSNDETDFIQRVSLLGGRVFFSNRMKVWHKISPKRLSMVFLFKRAWWQGISNRVQYPVNTIGSLRNIGGIASCMLRILFTPRRSRYFLLRLLEKSGYFWGLLTYRE
ncbi:MAG: glycosyltransferase [Candidatus Bathyarchaeota archaeon]|nr:glycosyltransferase [Candidatus Bathyarchaeota archaeon]